MNYVLQVDKDAVASWVLSFQAHPGDKNQLNSGMNLPWHYQFKHQPYWKWGKKEWWAICLLQDYSMGSKVPDPLNSFRTVMGYYRVELFLDYMLVVGKLAMSSSFMFCLKACSYLPPCYHKSCNFFRLIFLQVLINNLSHLASTYCALAILKIVGYNLSNVDSKSLLTSMRNLQQPDGRYTL